MISTTDFKRGARIMIDGEPYQIEDYQVQSPSARGAATLVRCKLRHSVTGSLLDRTFKAGEKFEEPDIAYRQVQFLYGDGESAHFMDLASFEQFGIPNDRIEDMVPWLTDGLQMNAIYWNGSVAGIHLPHYVDAEVEMVGAGARSDTASGKNLKEAVLTNGVTIRVPLFIDSGERVTVDPRTLEFIRRTAK